MLCKSLHGFAREIIASQRKSGTGNALINVSLTLNIKVCDHNINLRKSDIFCLECHISRDFVKPARKQQEKTGPGGSILAFLVSGAVFQRHQPAWPRLFLRPAKNTNSHLADYHRLNVMASVVEKLSPASRTAAAACLSHWLEPPSTPGRLCQGSMQTKWIFSVRALQIRV